MNKNVWLEKREKTESDEVLANGKVMFFWLEMTNFAGLLKLRREMKH
jgi:hypothetical protein